MCFDIIGEHGMILRVIGMLQNDEFLIYMFTDKVQNSTPIIFHKTLFHCGINN